ncbi:hypothetical protein IFM89_024778, partial [Coptis chinensis]
WRWNQQPFLMGGGGGGCGSDLEGDSVGGAVEGARLPIIDFTNIDLKPGTSGLPIIDFTNIDLKPGTSGDQVPEHQVFKAQFFGLHQQAPPLRPHHESMSIAGVLNFEKMERFTNMMWPQGNPRVSETIHSYAKQVVELDQLLRRMNLESMGVEKYYDEHIESNFYRFRVAKYTIPDQMDELNETKMGCRANTDMNLVTILSENQVQGLEITTKDGQGVQARVSSKIIQTQPIFG